MLRGFCDASTGCSKLNFVPKQGRKRMTRNKFRSIIAIIECNYSVILDAQKPAAAALNAIFPFNAEKN
jgi:hypothetical protein